MATNMKSSKSLFWDLYARCYDGLLDTIPYQRLLHKTLGRIPATTGALLDAGCGTGNLLAAVLRDRPDLRASLTGIDFSPEMLRHAQSKLPQARLHQANLDEPLPFADAAFDTITCINVLYAVPCPERTLAELKRVLKPNGTLIVSSPQAKPRISAFVCEHASEVGWIRTLPMLARLSVLVLFNILILRRGSGGVYHFLTPPAARRLLATDAVESAYSNQNWFATLTKSAI